MFRQTTIAIVLMASLATGSEAGAYAGVDAQASNTQATEAAAPTADAQPQEQAQEPTNQTVDGVRQGRWRIETSSGNVSEGNYVDGQKHGEWLTVGANGARRSLITYNKGKASGTTIYYFPDGNVMEKGIWNADHWEGAYERFYPNGNRSCSFVYNENGKRTGRQTYYHENGKVMYDGVWESGKITGALSIYNSDGQKTMERHYDNTGKFVGSRQSANAVTMPAAQKGFESTGQFTIYDAKGRKESSGYYEKGVLRDGEKYYYNAQGRLERTETIKNYKVVKGKK